MPEIRLYSPNGEFLTTSDDMQLLDELELNSLESDEEI